ncbi:hypothetical protein EBR03_08090 [bacterium]|nr:hypothetical protein [bacterium]NBX83092.1 hypothetical protein [bacterium]
MVRESGTVTHSEKRLEFELVNTVIVHWVLNKPLTLGPPILNAKRHWRRNRFLVLHRLFFRRHLKMLMKNFVRKKVISNHSENLIINRMKHKSFLIVCSKTLEKTKT